MSKTNRDLVGLNWQERIDGTWYAETVNYKCVAMPKPSEDLAATSSSFSQYTYDAMLYKWHAVEEVWVCIERKMFGSKGCQDAMLDAEEMLGKRLTKEEREADPEKRLIDDLKRELEKEQYKNYSRDREMYERMARSNNSNLLPPSPGYWK